MARHEGQVAGPEPGAGPAQPVLRVVRLAVLVDPEQGEVQVVAGVGEVVPVPAEGGDGEFRGHDQAHVAVHPVAVDPGLAPAVERHRLAGEPGAGLGRLDQARQGLLPGPAGLLVGKRRLDRLLQGPGDVLHVHEGAHLQPRNRQFPGPVRGEEAVLHVVVGGVGDLLDPAVGDVVVGEDQAVRADEGAAAAGQAQDGEADVLQPGRIRGEPVLGLDARGRHVVEGPHAFVRAQRGRRGPQEDGGQCDGADQTHRASLPGRTAPDKVSRRRPRSRPAPPPAGPATGRRSIRAIRCPGGSTGPGRRARLRPG